MREIKFRAFVEHVDSTGGNNNYSYMNYDVELHGNVNDIFAKSGIKPPNPLHNKVTYMQYTGLKDKNGKEIYLSDYVRGVHRNWEWGNVVEVTFLNGCFMFGNYNAHEFFNKHTEIEVIGNIHESPELIK